MARIAHLSDIHFGRIAHPEIVDVLVGEINASDVDLVVVSGDLTQRARTLQFQAAAAMLEAFTAPTLVVPGNHDVYAWWRPLSRILSPLRRYERHISPDLTPTFESEELSVLGINSAYGRTVKGGHIGGEARRAIRNFFKKQPAGRFKVLVVHHHLTRLQALGTHDVARKAERTLDLAVEVGVDLILCGHLHISHIEPIDVVPARHRIVIASAGTATSNRGRATNEGANFYNLVDVYPDAFVIEERLFRPDRRAFEQEVRTNFTRVA